VVTRQPIQVSPQTKPREPRKGGFVNSLLKVHASLGRRKRAFGKSGTLPRTPRLGHACFGDRKRMANIVFLDSYVPFVARFRTRSRDDIVMALSTLQSRKPAGLL